MTTSKRRILEANERTRALQDFGFESRLLAVLDNPGADPIASQIWYGPAESAMRALLGAAAALYWDLLPAGEIAPVVQLDDSTVHFLLLVRPPGGSPYLMQWQDEFVDQLDGGLVRFLVDSLDALWECEELDSAAISGWAKSIGCTFAVAFLDERQALEQPPSLEQHEALLSDFVARHSGRS